ncbi:hypothetical protein WEU32_06890 [Brevundimonas sp. BH3]|uniref:virion core protein, T7 gp14 family n=1 Tax=Brevundimonas sp. BH3 TaxID=3133089 RepID=UPI00324CAD50
MAVVAVASTAMTMVSEYQSAKHQMAAIDQQLAQAQKQVETSRVAELNDRQRVARKEAARVKVAAGQQGLNITGSVTSMLNDSLMQNQLAKERINLNAENEEGAAIAEANSMYSRVERPTALGAALKLGMSGAQGYYSGKSMQISRKNASKGPQ